jgi:hypothetical protein
MDLVYIYGPPATGKFTVATKLADLTGYAVFHNHLSIDCVLPLFEFGTDAFWRLVHEIRLSTIEAAAREDRSLIFTNVYAHPEDLTNAERRFAAVEGVGGRVCLVQLTSALEVLAARVLGDHRASMGKLANVEELDNLLQRYDVFTPIPGRVSLKIDNSDIEPAIAAQIIASHYDLARRQPSAS